MLLTNAIDLLIFIVVPVVMAGTVLYWIATRYILCTHDPFAEYAELLDDNRAIDLLKWRPSPPASSDTTDHQLHLSGGLSLVLGNTDFPGVANEHHPTPSSFGSSSPGRLPEFGSHH